MDREQSAAYEALTPAARRALHLIESEVAQLGGEARITFSQFGVTRTACRAIGQLVNLGFVAVGTGARSANVYTLVDTWRALDADEVTRRRTLPRPPRARWGRL